jgi:hypothetical protein
MNLQVREMPLPKPPVVSRIPAHVQCPICTHSVSADAAYTGRRLSVLRGQKCGRCRASLDAAAVLYTRAAA